MFGNEGGSEGGTEGERADGGRTGASKGVGEERGERGMNAKSIRNGKRDEEGRNGWRSIVDVRTTAARITNTGKREEAGKRKYEGKSNKNKDRAAQILTRCLCLNHSS